MTNWEALSQRACNSLRLGPKPRLIIVRMANGDQLKEYPIEARIFLHTSEPESRPSLRLRPQTIAVLVMSGLIYPHKDHTYDLTEEGQMVARMLCMQS